MRALAVIRTVAIKTCHEQHDRDGDISAGLFGETNEGGNLVALEGRAVGVRDDDLMDGRLPHRGSLQVHLFLAVEGKPLDVLLIVLLCVVDVREARDTIDDGYAAEEIRCLLGLVVLQGILGLFLKA